MSQVIVDTPEREGFKRSTTNLLDIVHNTLVLSHVIAHLPPSSITKLTATNRAIRDTITHTPGVHRHLDLTTVKRAYNHPDEATLTEYEFHSAPLRSLLSTLQRRNILQDVSTLVLDGLSVTADLCHDIIHDPRLNVRLLSLRDVANLNHAKLRATLQHACRPPSRHHHHGPPRLKGVYIFGAKDHHHHPAGNDDGGDAWWAVKGRQLRRPVADEWAACMLACAGALVFDAPLCHGPRHRNSRAAGTTAGVLAEHRPAVATYALAGCAGCGAAPEGMTLLPSSSSTTTEQLLPLLAPPPTTSSSLRAATTPGRAATPFVPRCGECIRERHCQCCDKWWCEACDRLPGQAGGRGSSPAQEPAVVILEEGDGLALEDYIALQEAGPKVKNRVTKSCWECGNSCEDCIDKTQRVCKKCCAGYCTVHNEGSSAEFCDWCVSRGRRLAKTKGHEGSPPPPTILRDIRHLNHIRRRAGF